LIYFIFIGISCIFSHCVFSEWHSPIEMHVGHASNGSNQRTTSVPLINLHNCIGVTAIDMRYAVVYLA